MKKLIITITIIFILSINVFSQWYQQNSGTTFTLLSVQFVNNNIGWIVGTGSQGVHLLFKTNNGGADWFEQDTIMNSSEGFYTASYFLNELTGWIIVYKTNETSNIYKTTDGGNNWDLQFSTPPFEVVLSDIQFVDSLNGYSTGTGQLSSGYIYKTTDGGGSWELSLGTAFPIASFSLSFVNSSTGWVAGSNILKTTNSGGTWMEQLNIEPDRFSSIQFINSQIGWATIDYLGIIYKTNDGGNNWFQQSAIELNSTFFVDEINGWLTKRNNIYKTSDGGDNWVLQNSNTGQDLWDLFFIDQNEGWTVGNNGTILHTLNSGLPVELVNFSTIVRPNYVMLHWTTATEINNSGFEIERSLTPTSSQTEGAFETTAFVPGHGTTSEKQSYSFNDENLSSGKYQYRLKQIDFDGSFEYSNTIEVEITAPLEFSLEQNYPNPFNPSTNIKYVISSRQFVTLKIFNSLGEEIETLVNEFQDAGVHSKLYIINSTLPSGVYFYELKAGEFVQTRKMLLLK